MKGSSAPSLLVLALFIAIAPLGIPAPEQKKSKVNPTFIRDSKAEVGRGGEVVITLGASRSYGNMETFEIQTPPAHGSLSDLKNGSDHSATVIYHHDGSKEALEDVFVFRAKAPGQSFSSPAKAVITIIPPPPRLTIEPRDLDFGKVLLSGTRATNVLLTNLGGGRATGRIILPSGFSSPNGGGYSLLEGESLPVPIEFSPMQEKEYAGKIECLPRVETTGLLLRGIGIRRYEVTPVGQASWNIRNLSTNQIRISFLPVAGTAGWILPPESLLGPGSEKVFTFPQEDDEEAESVPSKPSKVSVSDGLSESLLDLPPPRRFSPLTVRAVTPSVLGSIPLGGSAIISFSLLNRSDVPKRAYWKIASALGGGISDSSFVELQSGESKEIHHTWTPTVPGEGVLRLTVEEGKKTSHELLWTARVSRDSDARTMPRITPSLNAPEVGRVPGGEVTGPPADPPLAPPPAATPLVDGAAVEVLKNFFGFPRVIARWDAKPGAASNTLLQECLLVPGSEKAAPAVSLATSSSSMMLKLQDLHHQSLQSNGRGEMALIQGLQPGWHLIMISQTTGEGGLQARSQMNVFVPRNPTFWGLVKMPLGILSLVLLILLYRKIRRGE